MEPPKDIKFRAVLNLEARTYPEYEGSAFAFDFNLEEVLRGSILFSNPNHWKFYRFTYLQDKHGKDIYESDIVRWRQGVARIESAVLWNTGCWFPFSGAQIIPTKKAEECEIIGATYDIPLI